MSEGWGQLAAHLEDDLPTESEILDFRGSKIEVGSVIVFQSGRQSNRWLSEAEVNGFVTNSKDEVLILATVKKVSRIESPWHAAQQGSQVKVKPDMVTVLNNVSFSSS